MSTAGIGSVVSNGDVKRSSCGLGFGGFWLGLCTYGGPRGEAKLGFCCHSFWLSDGAADIDCICHGGP